MGKALNTSVLCCSNTASGLEQQPGTLGLGLVYNRVMEVLQVFIRFATSVIWTNLSQ